MKFSDWKWIRPLLDAVEAGKTIQFMDSHRVWVDIDPTGCCSFHFGEDRYRIKPLEYRLGRYTTGFCQGVIFVVTRLIGVGTEDSYRIARERDVQNDEAEWLTEWLPLPEGKEEQ